ncbi:MAG: hypothetical protein ABIQ02_02955 [Saprospiraceae bacterium]
MKSLLPFFALLCTTFMQLSAQNPACTVNYQAVIRDATDKILPNRNVVVQLSVLDGPGGGAVYIEQHNVLTNSLGLLTLEVGAGTKIGGSDWMLINWLAHKYFLKVEADINGGQNFEVLGESPILAVPIAIQAKYAALSYQTIDTITKVVKTLIADTLKSKIACLDTIKAHITYLDTIRSKKIYAKKICVDSIPGNVYIEYVTGKAACFDEIKTDTLYAKKGYFDDLFVLDSFLTRYGTIFYLHVVDSLETPIAKIDTIRTFKEYARSICTDSILTGKVTVSRSDGGTLDVIRENPDGRIEVNADKVNAASVCTDSMMSDKITAKSICADTIKSKIISLTYRNGETEPIIFEGPNAGQSVVDALIIQGNYVNGQLISLIDGTGSGRLIGYVDIDDKTNLKADKITAGNICTMGLTVQDAFLNPILKVDPAADPFTEYAVVLNGNIMVNGGIMAAFKQFVIDHPLDPEHKRLHHFSVESDQMSDIYHGNIVLDENGESWVVLPDWFEALNKDFTYQLTCIGGHADVYVAEEIKGNRFKIAGGFKGLKISWQVSGVRHDKQALENQFPVEELKG